MKLFILLTVLYLIAILSESQDEEEFVRVVIPLAEKYFDSDGNSKIAPSNVHHRSIRETKSGCLFPNKLSGEYQLDCKLYPNRVKCTQTCPYGHTLPDGIQRVMKCKYEENQWLPISEFDECKPFVDCTLSLGPGGNYRCNTNYLEKGPICQISCRRYEDWPEVPPKTYHCDINGTWSPKLPHCAKSGSGMTLVPPPKGAKRISKLRKK